MQKIEMAAVVTAPAPLTVPTACVPPRPQLAARIAVSNLHKNTLKSFSET